jgi:hypothetical protein
MTRRKKLEDPLTDSTAEGNHGDLSRLQRSVGLLFPREDGLLAATDTVDLDAGRAVGVVLLLIAVVAWGEGLLLRSNLLELGHGVE